MFQGLLSCLTPRRLGILPVHPAKLVTVINLSNTETESSDMEIFKLQATIICSANSHRPEKCIFWQECCDLEPMHSTMEDGGERTRLSFHE